MPASSSSVNDILLHRAQELTQWQHLKDARDAFSFQQALTGYRVYFDASNVKWLLDGSEKPGKCGMARVQLWEAKRLPKLPTAEDSDQSPLSSVNSSTPSPQPLFERGFGQRRLTGVSSTITSSSRTSQIAGNRACNATVVHPPEPPVLIIYTLCDGKFTFLHLILGEEIFVNERACLCKKSPKTCLRIVLGSKKKKIKLRKHCASEPGEQGLHSWDLARFACHAIQSTRKLRWWTRNISAWTFRPSRRRQSSATNSSLCSNMFATLIFKNTELKSRSVKPTAIELVFFLKRCNNPTQPTSPSIFTWYHPNGY